MSGNTSVKQAEFLIDWKKIKINSGGSRKKITRRGFEDGEVKGGESATTSGVNTPNDQKLASRTIKASDSALGFLAIKPLRIPKHIVKPI